MTQPIDSPVALSARIVICSAVGYTACRIFTVINPLSAVLYNTIHELASAILPRTPILNSLFSFTLAFYGTNIFFKLTTIEALKVTALTIITYLPVAIINIYDRKYNFTNN